MQTLTFLRGYLTILLTLILVSVASVGYALLLFAGVYWDALVSGSYGLVFTLTVPSVCFACFFCRAACEFFGYFWAYKYKPQLYTWMIDCGRVLPKRNGDKLRDHFNSIPMPRRRVKTNHSHGKAASIRSIGRYFAQSYCQDTGLEQHVIQMSRTDQQQGLRGDRTYYWEKDVSIDPRYATPPPGSLIHMVDVDYYIDMPWFLTWHTSPVLLHTFVPSAAAHNGGNYSYTFNEDNTVTFNVAGGRTYHHALWNYGNDSLVASWKIAGITLKTALYKIDRRNVGDDHMAILLTPIGHWWGIMAWLAAMLSDARLQRLNVVDEQFTRLHIQTDDGLQTSTGRVGSYLSATIPADVDAAIAGVARLMKQDLNAHTVQTYTSHETRDALEAIVLAEYHRLQSKFKPDFVYPVQFSVNNYTYAPEKAPPVLKPSVVPFMSPIYPAAFAPYRSKENDEACIRERLEKIKSEVYATPEIAGYINEFTSLLAPQRGCLTQKDMDEVYERQNRPTQRRIIDEAVCIGPNMERKRKVQSFQKAETYSEVKPPRNISTINGADKVAYSRYIYALADYVKTRAHWYAFGKTPREIAMRVAHVARTAKSHGINSDLSRFDGRLGPVFRQLERSVLLALYPECEHDRIIELHGSQFQLRGTTNFGVQYSSGFSRLSGSPETAIFNSIDNAFMCYVTFRRTGQCPSEAYTSLGVYGGDDGFTADMECEVYAATAADLGMKTAADVIPKGHMGVKFLARTYGPGVWAGDCNSCCDITRQLGKLHVTTVLPQNISPSDKLVEKMRGFYLSDANTPIIGELATKTMQLTTSSLGGGGHMSVLDVNGETIYQVGRDLKAIAEHHITNAEAATSIRPYASLAASDDQYPNEDQGWMAAYALSAVPSFDYARFRAALQAASSVEDLLKLPQCAEPPPPNAPAPVVINDLLVLPPPAQNPPAKRKTRAAKWKEQTKAGKREEVKAPSPRGKTRAKKDKWADLGNRRSHAKKN